MKYDLETYYEVPEVNLPYLAAIGLYPMEFPFDRNLTAYYVALKDGTIENYKGTYSCLRDRKKYKLLGWKEPKYPIPEFNEDQWHELSNRSLVNDTGGVGSPFMPNSFEDGDSHYRDYETFIETYYRQIMQSKIPGSEWMEPGEYPLPDKPKPFQGCDHYLGTPWTLPFRASRFNGDKLTKNHNRLVKLLDKYGWYKDVLGEPSTKQRNKKNYEVQKGLDAYDFLLEHNMEILKVPLLYEKLLILFFVWPDKFQSLPGTLTKKAEMLVEHYVNGKKYYKKKGQFIKLFDKRFKELVSR